MEDSEDILVLDDEIEEEPLDTVAESELVPAIPLEKSRAVVPYDPLQIYLMEIKRYKLLTREEELELAVRAAEEKDEKAIYALVTSNLRLVVKIAMDFHRYWTKTY